MEAIVKFPGLVVQKAVFVCATLLVTFAARATALDLSETTAGYVRKNFTVEDGLLSNRVNAVLQTRDGFIWVGTEAGLLRFDGRHFTAIEFLPKASHVLVSALAEAPDGALWVGTRGGLARIPSGGPGELEHITSSQYHPGAGDADWIQCLHFSRKGDLFVGTMTGLYRFEHGGFSVIIPELWTSRVEETSSGRLLVITSKGFVEWDGTQVIRHPDLPARLGVGQNEIFHVFEDHTGTIWYCTSAGLARQIGGAIERLKPYGRDVVFRVNEDPEGTVWFAQSGGLYRVGSTGRELVASNLNASYLAFDRDGDLWAGTKGTGLFRLKPRAVKMFTVADGLPDGVPMAVLAASDGKLWVGSDCGGLSWFDGRRFQTYAERDGLTNSCVFSLAEGRNHDILIGTFGGGVFRFREGRFTEFLKEDKLRNNVPVAILPATDGSLWIAYSDGLTRIRDGQIRKFTTADGLSSNSVLSGYADQHGVIWVQTTAGIDYLEKDRFVAVSKTNNASIGVGRFGFGEDRSGELFAFGPFAGTFHVQANRVVRLDGTPKITGMLKSRENLWFCGDGIYRASPDSVERWERERDAPRDYTRFDRTDGMNSAECSGGFRNLAMTNDGKLWAATEQGVGMLESSQLRRNDRKPAIYIERIVIGKTPQPPGRELVLPAGTHHVELHFDSIDLASPESIRMQYRLDDVDREWLDADSAAVAIYSGLPIGSHAFHLRACNSDGVWDRTGVVYNIIQQPFFYETGLFHLAAVALLALLLAGAYRVRFRRITAQMTARLDERVAERTRLARDLHDTLLQTIQASKIVAANAIHDAHDPRTSAALEKLARWLDKAMQEARASLLSLRTSTTETNDLAEALRHQGEECAAAHPVQFNLVVAGTAKEMHPIVRDEVYWIGYEAIRNAAAHSGGSRVEVVLTYANCLELRVSDNGKGIDLDIATKGKPGHFGLTGMRERATRIGAHLTIRSSGHAGTEVELMVPGRIAFCEQASHWKSLFKRHHG
jgi:signal transduction histidine kinase/ligand-binding sensor domain-containing protein